MSIDRRMDKEDVVHIYNGILLSHKTKRNWVICRSRCGPREKTEGSPIPGTKGGVPQKSGLTQLSALETPGRTCLIDTSSFPDGWVQGGGHLALGVWPQALARVMEKTGETPPHTEYLEPSRPCPLCHPWVSQNRWVHGLPLTSSSGVLWR